jgi:hypothetical protein
MRKTAATALDAARGREQYLPDFAAWGMDANRSLPLGMMV